MSRQKVDIVTMGCSKNLVDSERVLRMFDEAGFDAVHNADGFSGGAVVINTCGFIGDAKEESVEMILRAAKAKSDGAITGLYVMGCLSERYRDELRAEIPEVDRWYGKFDWDGIVRDLTAAMPQSKPWERRLTTPPHHAYIKIAEGCNRFCSFCAIPLITGRFKSRPVEEIVEETRMLVARGVKEFNVIAQDLSSYGTDLYGRQELARLIDAMADVEGVERIRLHYAYPADFPWDITEVMRRRDNVCKYLDVALQHVSDKVLANMRRHITGAETRAFLERLRREVPGIHIRTTLMVGFPGEGDEEFDELLEFVAEQRFERMGAFAYCEEEDTYGAKHFRDEIPDEVKQARLDRLMELQREIADEISRSKIGSRQRVIIDCETEDFYVGRTEFDSPEVDPEVLVEKTRKLATGQIVDVEITGADTFELYGRPS